MLAIWTVDRLGRKPLMLVGSAGMAVCLLALGLAAYWQRTEIWTIVFILGYIACFALSVGPVTWVILSEIFPTRHPRPGHGAGHRSVSGWPIMW